jgi:putative ABC transport system ATP-binding protein
MPTPDVAISARGVEKSYSLGHARVEALRGVTLEIAAGSFVSVMGPSGSGKSTLLHCLAGLDRATAGEISVDGVELGKLDEEALAGLRRRKIGIIFQFYNLLSDLNVEDNVAVPLLLDGLAHAEVTRRVGNALASVGFAEMATRFPAELSGGEMQRTAIARALAIEPSILLADEPTGNLDSANGSAVLALLRRACDERRQTVVLVTHDANAAACGDRVIELRDGKVAGDRANGKRPV